MSLLALRAALADHGGKLAAQLTEAPVDGAVVGRESAPGLAASGPRAVANPAEYELLIEMIYEGTLLHYGTPRVLRSDDPDLSLLLGDQLYALGLARLAELGDLDAVAELADLISLLAQAQAQGPGEDGAGSAAELVDALWEASATAIGWGADDDLERAKASARAGNADAPEALRRAAAGAR
jgi:hypothetical protein